MRDLVVFVADLTMEKEIEAFLKRPDFNAPYNLNTRPFEFDPAEDLIRIPGCDAGVFSKGHEWLQAYRGRHRHAAVVFDREFGTDRGASELRDELSGRILRTGWNAGHFRVVVIDPELEAWIWQRNHRVATPLGFTSVDSMVEAIRGAGLDWPDGQSKPTRPKEALEAVVRRRGIGWSSAIHRSITSSISLIGCQDPAFIDLRNALQEWFPGEAPA